MNALIHFLRKHTSVRRRLIMAFFIPGILFYLFSTTQSLLHVNSLSEARLNEIELVVSSAVGKTAAQFINRGLKHDLEEVLHSLITNTAVVKAIVYDIDNKIFAESGQMISMDKVTEFRQFIYYQPVIPEFDEFDFNIGVTKDARKQVGMLLIYVDQEIVQNQSLQIILSDLTLFVTIIILSSPLFYALYKSFNLPLSSLLDNINRFGDGNLNWSNELNEIEYADEFSEVHATLKIVASKITDQKTLIHEANCILEQRASDLKRQVAIATEARKEADRANSQKDCFVENVSHEMRHPLVGIISGVDLVEQFIICTQNRLMDTNLATTSVQFIAIKRMREDLKNALHSLEISKTYSKDLTILIDDLLASIQDMNQEISLSLTVILLYDSLQALFHSHAEFAHIKGLDYQFIIKGLDGEEPLYVQGDWARISQVVNIILDNAIRFTEKGKVTVTADISLSEGQTELSIFVADTGVGIRDSEQIAIFKLLQIGENPTDKLYSRLGNGLAVASKISDRMNGRLHLDYSKPETGSCFSFKISLPVASPQFSATDEFEYKVKKQYSLLYVEDSAINRQVFKMYCELSGISLIQAQNGIEGIERFMSHQFDALIVDCYMPKMNGYEFVRKIRAMEAENETSHIKIFALTADASARNRKKCLDAGFDEFLIKPYTKATIKFIVDRIC